MASRGSVIPFFVEQIKNGLPLTVTNPKMTRFLMSMDEAIELVIYAFQHAQAGDIMVKKAPSSTIGDLALAIKEVFNADNVGPMIIDVKRIIEIKRSINELEEKIEDILKSSKLAETIGSIPGFGAVCTAELVAEIGTMERFSSERSLALYLGMAPLDKSSGKCQGTRTPTQINKRGKAAMMTAVAHNIRKVEESKRYYQKKRDEGKSHNQAVRALGRHMIRVIWSMTKRNEVYQIREGENKTCSDETSAAIPA